MQWIVDSGGTKAIWRCENGREFRTEGISPQTHSSEYIHGVLKRAKDEMDLSEASVINWYGTGCNSLATKSALKKVFDEIGVSHVSIEHDLLGAARAVLGKSKGIVGILGTGSNACIYDGKHIIHEKLSLGYMIGDEGSGAYMGKKLLKDFLEDNMPEKEAEAFEAMFGSDKRQFIQQLYKHQRPSAYLGQFTLFLDDVLEHSVYANDLVHDALMDFRRLFIEPFADGSYKRIGFVGGLAYALSSQLQDMCTPLDLQWVSAVKSPIDGLMQYHGFSDN